MDSTLYSTLYTHAALLSTWLASARKELIRLLAAAKLGAEHGREHAEELASEGADAATLAACALPSNDWSVSSSEAWSLAGSKAIGGGALEESEDPARLIYCQEYEHAARVRCGELAAEMEEEEDADEEEEEEELTYTEEEEEIARLATEAGYHYDADEIAGAVRAWIGEGGDLVWLEIEEDGATWYAGSPWADWIAGQPKTPPPPPYADE